MINFLHSEKYNRIKRVIFLTIAVVSIIYYCVCIAFAHIGVSWLWIWPALSAFCLVRYFMLCKKLFAPAWLAYIYRVLLLAFFALFIAVEAKVVTAMHIEPEKNLDYIITLGAAVRNGEPTSPLKLRINKTIEYLNDNPDTILIASGGQGSGESLSEARCIADYVIAAGIDESRIILEDKSSDTEENICNSFKIIPEGSAVGLVTSSFHVYRAMRIAALQGHKVYGVPAVTYYPLGYHYIVREFFGIVQLEAENLLKSLA